MRGYGRSTIHSAHGDYALEHGVHDMLDLLVHLGRDHSIWGSGQAASVPCDAGVISEQDLSMTSRPSPAPASSGLNFGT